MGIQYGVNISQQFCVYIQWAFNNFAVNF